MSHAPSHHGGDLATIDEVNPVAESSGLVHEPEPAPLEVPPTQVEPTEQPSSELPLAENPTEVSGAVSVGDTTEAASTINPDNPPPTEGGSEATAIEGQPKKEKKKREPKTPKPEPPPGLEFGETDAASKRVSHQQ